MSLEDRQEVTISQAESCASTQPCEVISIRSSTSTDTALDDDDVFDPFEDSLIAALEYDESDASPAKKSKIAVTDSDEFSGDEDELSFVADAMEEQLDGPARKIEFVEKENRFESAIGRPHPMLTPCVVETIVSHVHDGGTLKNMREVCKLWNEAATPKLPEHTRFLNIQHIIEKSPYGLGYDSRTMTFENKPPQPIQHLKVADPCLTLTKDAATMFFRHQGHFLKSFSFDANFWCVDHFQLLRTILTLHCRNLESLELIGVSNRRCLEMWSRLELPELRLTELIVSVKRNSIDHYHFSTSRTVHPDLLTSLVYGGRGYRDGGIIGSIVHNSPNLRRLTVRSDFYSPALFLDRCLLARVPFRAITHLELSGGTIITNDLRYIEMSHFISLKSLHLGPFSPRVNTTVLKSLLTSLSPTLEHLSLDTNLVQKRATDVFVVLRLKLPMMPVLKSFRISNVFPMRLWPTRFISRIPSLESLHLSNSPVSSLDPEHYASSQRYLPTLFSESMNNIYCMSLKRIAFDGHYGYPGEHAQLITSAFPNLTEISLVTGSVEHVTSFFEKFSALGSLQTLDVCFFGKGVDRFKDAVRSHLKFFSALVTLRLEFRAVPQTVPLHLDDVLQGYSTAPVLQKLGFTGFSVFDDDAEELSTLLANRFTHTSFKECSVTPRKMWRGVGVPVAKPIRIHDVVLSLVNLRMLIRSHFHTI